MNIFADKTIRNRVMQVVEKRIENSQQKYESGVVEIDQEAEKRKAELADKLVSEIIGDFAE